MAARLDLRALMSACVHLARRGGRIIREVHQSGHLGEHNKKVEGDVRAVEAMAANEVLTVADNRAQDAIVTSLRSMFPRLRLVGEEGEVAGKEAATPFEEVEMLDPSFEAPPELAEALTEADTCLWIDPLDGTKEFVLNNLENVSVLIGIAVRDRPVGGVMFQPFVGGERGTVTYGALGLGVRGDREPPVSDPPEELVIVTNPKSAELPRVKAALEGLDIPHKLVLANASGNKLLRVLRGEASAFVIGPGPSRWDTCAGEGLLLAVGGKATTMDGQPYTYEENGEYENKAGLIAARTEAIHALLERAFAPDRSE